MDWDEPKTPNPKALMLGEDLSALSIGELEARVRAMREEILRIEAAVAAKRAHEAAAAQLFKS